MKAIGISFIAFLALLACGCQPVSAIPTGTITGTTTTTNTPPPVGTVDNTKGFQVWALNPQYSIHSDGQTAFGSHTYAASMSWSNPATCVAATGQDVMCFIEAAELDLWFNGVNIQYNVPTNMCQYVQIEYPWYFTQPAGLGGTSVQYTVAPTGTTDVQNSQQGTPYCPFNYTATGGPNCCGGTYDLSVTTVVVAPSGNTSSTTTSTGSWGGNPINCLSGAATKLAGRDINGYPITTWISSSGSGAASEISVASPLSMNLNGNTYVANYFDISAAPSTAKNYDNYDAVINPTGLQTTDYPPGYSPFANTKLAAGNYAIPGSSPSITTSGLSLATGAVAHPYYTFECYDNYQEVVARIRVMVRSWDVISKIGTATDYTPNYATEGGVGGNSPMHDKVTWGDLYFNYLDNSGQKRLPWALTAGDANCSGTAYQAGVSYASGTPPCVQNTSAAYTYSSGFPGLF